MMFQVEDAIRSQQLLRLALTGPSGSGKTLSALLIARGMVDAIDPSAGKEAIIVVDTERGSASLYADKVPFRRIDFRPPYRVTRYIEAIEAAEKAQPLVIILDQISHAWAGEGGLLEAVDTLKKKARNEFAAWGEATPIQNRFIERMLGCSTHLIVTMRSKMEYVLEMNDRGKQVPRKVGLAPVQRQGMEYEFTTVLDIDAQHQAFSTKDRTGLFEERQVVLSKETGSMLIRWLQEGDPQLTPEYEPEPEPEPESESLNNDPEDKTEGFGEENPDRTVTDEEWKHLISQMTKRAAQIGVDWHEIQRRVLEECRASRGSELTLSDLQEALEMVRHFKKEDLT